LVDQRKIAGNAHFLKSAAGDLFSGQANKSLLHFALFQRYGHELLSGHSGSFTLSRWMDLSTSQITLVASGKYEKIGSEYTQRIKRLTFAP
jgi:hypothetical protein